MKQYFLNSRSIILLYLLYCINVLICFVKIYGTVEVDTVIYILRGVFWRFSLLSKYLG